MVATGAEKARTYSGDYMDAGKLAESIVENYLQNNPQVESVINRTADVEKQRQEIDFDVILKTGTEIFVEVKSDSYLGRSGNILFEFARINHTVLDLNFCVNRGWSILSRATHFYYYAPSVNSLYIVKAVNLRKGMQAYTLHARKNTRIDYVATDNIKSTLNILIPIDYVKEIEIVKL